MAFSIKNPEADRLVREISEVTGESLTRAVVHALRDRLEKVKARRDPRALAAELDEIAIRAAKLTQHDTRTPEEIIGYDEKGLPG